MPEEEQSVQRGSVSAVVIPAFEPDERLTDLAASFAACGNAVIVIDDGSGDAYRHIFDRLTLHCIVLHHSKNLGKGAALKTAFRYIDDCMPRVACITTVDADGQHLLTDAEKIAMTAWANPGTLVLGSRAFGGRVPLRSILGNRITCWFFRRISGVTLHDTQTGLRAFDRSLLKTMRKIPGSRYEYEMNVLLRCARGQVPIKEVSIRTVYHDRKNSCSHFHAVKDSFRIYRNLLKFSASSLAGFSADYILFLGLQSVLPAGAETLVLSNVLARICSAALNYGLNNRLVFHNSVSVKKTLPQYAALATGILAANSAILSFLADDLGVPSPAAKLITEITLFCLSYSVQVHFIFRRNGHDQAGESDAVSSQAKRKSGSYASQKARKGLPA